VRKSWLARVYQVGVAAVGPTHCRVPLIQVSVRDLWAHADRGVFGGEGFTDVVGPHGVCMIRATRVQ
jgi:hypothetical protein